jgi:murein DD-endopeptidase
MLLALAATAAAQIVTPTPLELAVPHPPSPARALGRVHLVYELHVTNFGPRPLRVVGISALDANTATPIGRWTNEELARMAVHASSSGRDPLTVASGERVVYPLWATLEPGAVVPASLRHEVEVESPDEARQNRLEGGNVEVDARSPLSVESPVGGGRWVAVRGPSNRSGHRRTLVALDGRIRVAQRFAVDFVRLGDDGRWFEGDGSRNEDWYGYDEQVFAATAGRVVRVVDGIADGPPRTVETDRQERGTVAGNVVVIDAGDGRYAIYAHLRPGSIEVTEGDEVAAGDAIGRIGSSGHSLAPHLHFHIGDAADVLASEGMPFALDGFHLIGRLDSVPLALAGEAWSPSPTRPGRRVTEEMPLENMVLELPVRP